jgi:ribosomal small subunit protein bTHX
MGKGDQRTRRGKVHRGTFGKTRPKGKKKPVGPVVAPRPRARKKS